MRGAGQRLHSFYADLWSAYTQMTVAMSASERYQLFVENAIRYYRLSHRLR